LKDENEFERLLDPACIPAIRTGLKWNGYPGKRYDIRWPGRFYFSKK